MKLDEPTDFELEVGGGSYRLFQDSLPAKFAAPLSTRGVAKLYTVSSGGLLLYVGIAQQPMSARLSYGFRANGKSGYYGYKWRGLEGALRLSVWTGQTDGSYASLRDMETIEAEVAFLCRRDSGQWPAYQHEIHFFPSSLEHREAARLIYLHSILRKSAMPGSATLAVEVTHVSGNGIWLLLGDEELLMPFEAFPWFRKATIEQISRVERPTENHLYWPDLDVDLSVESIRNPDAFPLRSRGG